LGSLKLRLWILSKNGIVIVYLEYFAIMPVISSLTSVVNFFNNSDAKQFIIPMYQRSYRWDKDQINDFLNDLETLLTSPSQSKYHFFGLLVLCETIPNSKKFDIIDGQQRITTISLLIAILRDLINDLSYHTYFRGNPQKKEELEEMKNKLNSCLTDSGNLKLTTMNEAVYESDYLKIVLGKITDLSQIFNDKYSAQPEDTKNSFELKWEALCETPKFNQTRGKAKPIRKNFDILHDAVLSMLENLDYEQKLKKITAIVTTVIEHFKIIPFVAQEEAEAFSLFETLNDRGLDVAAGDLIKNLCLKMGVDKEHRNSIFTLWKKIFTENLADLDGIIFLRYAYNSRYEFIMKSELFKSYAAKIQGLTKTELDTYLENLLNDSINYKTIISDDNALELDLRNILRLLKSTGSTQYITLALAILRCLDLHSNSQHLQAFKIESYRLLKQLHKLVLSISIHGQGMNQIERIIPSLAVKISNHTNLLQAKSICTDCIDILQKHISNNGLKVESETLEDLILDSNYLSLALINTVNYVSLPHSQTLPNNLTLEHIFPQKYKNGDWPKIEALRSEDLINSTCLYSIGNHIPLLQGLNSSASNKNLDDKRIEYSKNSYKDFPFEDNELNIYNIIEFTPDIIKERKKELNNILINYLKNQ
jgi:hypothetical protein